MCSPPKKRHSTYDLYIALPYFATVDTVSKRAGDSTESRLCYLRLEWELPLCIKKLKFFMTLLETK